MDFFKKKISGKVETDNFNRSPLRSQSQCTSKKKDSSLSRSQTFTIGLPVYSVENDPLGSHIDGPLSQASSGYLSINGEVTSPTNSNVSLYSDQKSDYGGSTSTVSGVSSVDSETLNAIYSSRYGTTKPQNLEKRREIAESVTQVAPERNDALDCRGTKVKRRESIRSTGSSRSAASRSDSTRSSTRSYDSGHSSRVRSPESVRSYRSSASSSSTNSSSSSRVSRVKRSRHSKIPEEPDPYFTKGICSSFREDGSVEVKVRASPDFSEVVEKPIRRHSRSGSFRKSRPCLSMLRDRDTQSLEGLDRIEGESTLDRKARRDARSVGNLVQVPVPTVPSDYESAGTLKRNAKSVGNLIGESRDVPIESSRSTGDLLETPSNGRNQNKKDAFFKRGIFKLFKKKSSEKAEEKKKKLPKSKSSTLDYGSRNGSSDALVDASKSSDYGNRRGSTDTLKSSDTLKSKSDTLRSTGSREGTLTRENVNRHESRPELRDSRDFDRNDSLERAIHSNSGTLTRDNCGRSKDYEDPYGKVGALNAILRQQQAKSPAIVKKRVAPPVPQHRTSKSKSTYQILDEIKAQNHARSIESQPIPDDLPTPDSEHPPSPGPLKLKRDSLARDSRSLGALATSSGTLKRHQKNLPNVEEGDYDLPPPPEELLGACVVQRPSELAISDKPKGILKKTPELYSPRELKNAVNEPFYAKNQQRRVRPKCPPPVPPHANSTVVTQVQVHREDRPSNVRFDNRPPVPEHKNLDLHHVQLRKTGNIENLENSVQKRRSQGNVLDNNINEEIKNVVLRRTKPQPKAELHSQIENVVLRKTQNRGSLRNSVVMDPTALVYGKSVPAAIVHQGQPHTVRLVSQPRHGESENRNSVFDALNEHSDTLKKMAKVKPQLPRKPSFKNSNVREEGVYGIMESYMESRKSMDSLDSEDSYDSCDFPPPPPPICDYNTPVDC